MDDGQNENTPTFAKRPFWQWLLLIAIIAILLSGGGYYLLSRNGTYQSVNNAQGQQTTSSTTSTATPTSITSTPSGSTSTMAQISVTGNEFSFTPSQITVSKGQKVEITFKNAGVYPHNLTITDLGVKTKTIQPGQQDTISFVPDKTGSFKFLCTVLGHADRGMVGTLTVK